ncbi:MAG: hypothetical protein AAFZ65_06495, partial [Planctomycetota bacterium]
MKLKTLTLPALLLPTAMAAMPTAAAQTSVQGITVEGGVSIRNDLYTYVADSIAVQNSGRMHTNDHAPFAAFAVPFDLSAKALSQFLSDQGVLSNGILALCGYYPLLCGNGFVGSALSLLFTACLGDEINMTLGVKPETVHGGFEFGSMTFSTGPNQHIIDLRVDRAGVLFGLDMSIGVGSNPLCEELLFDERYKSAVYLADLDYRITISVDSPQPQVDVVLLTDLSNRDLLLEAENFPSILDGPLTFIGDLFDFIFQFTVGLPLRGSIEDFAEGYVVDQLDMVFEDWWLPYLPWEQGLLDLNSTAQVQSFTANEVDPAFGSPHISDAQYLTMATDLVGSRVQATFIEARAGVSGNALATEAQSDLVPSMADVDFSFGVADSMCTYYLNAEAIQYVAEAGVVAAVGHRSADKAGGANDLRVSVPFEQLAPEHAGWTVTELLDLLPSTPSTITPLPVTYNQRRGLAFLDCLDCTTPQKLGDASLHQLTFEVEIREVDRDIVLEPFGANATNPGGDFAHGWSDVQLITRVMQGDTVWIEERFDATFDTLIRMIHTFETKSHDLGGVETALVSLVSEAGYDQSVIIGGTGTDLRPNQAPVSFLMRALFAARDMDPGLYDDRFYYLIEGLAGPLMERSMQSFIRMPGLDLPNFSGTTFGYTASADSELPGCPVGLRFGLDKQCAVTQRWGYRPGTGLSTDPILAIEVDWIDPSSPLGIDTGTQVTVIESLAGSGTSIPSIEDKSYVRFDYQPTKGGQVSRVMNATGFRT